MDDRAHQIASLIEAAADATGWQTTTVSWRASGSGATHDRLLRGCDITTRRAARIVQWLSDHWPASAEWPEDLVPRPPPTGGGNGPAPSPAAPAPAPAPSKRPRKPERKQADSAMAPDPGTLDVPSATSIRLAVATAEPDGLSEWARQRGWPERAVHQALARHAGRRVRLARLSERTRAILAALRDAVERDAAQMRRLVSSERFTAVAADLGLDLPGTG